MKKLDSFFVMILALVLALTGIFFYSYKTLNYFETNKELKAKLERKKSLISLQKRMDELANTAKLNRQSNQRSVASLTNNLTNEPDDIEFAIETNIDASEPAKKYYLEAKIKCYELNKEIECIRIIESAVTHFPDSSWTAESLVLLTEFYYRTKRTANARDILKILKDDFKKDESVQKKVLILERHIH